MEIVARAHLPSVDNLHHLILEEMRNGLVVTDGEGRVVVINRAARELAIEVEWLLKQEALLRSRRGVVDVRTIDRLGTTREVRIEATRHGDHTFFMLRDIGVEVELAKLRRVETLGMLTASLLHDFNNLLAIINGASAVLLHEIEKGSPLEALASEIACAAERAASLSRSTMRYARREPRAVAPVDVVAVTRELQPLLERLVGDGVTLAVEPSSDAPAVVADREHLEHVLLNLVANARDAMPHGGRIVIRIVADASDVVLSVVDTGVGMCADVREHALEPFFTTKPNGKGTGLGLASVQRFASDSGGTITVRSEPGNGTVVSIRLPGVEA